MTGQNGNADWKSCLLPAAVGLCEFQKGDGISNSDEFIGDAANPRECAALVMTSKPEANGATYSNQQPGNTKCFAEYGMSVPASSSSSGSWQTCSWSPPPPPPPPPAPSCATQSDCAGIDTGDYQCKDSGCVAPTASVTTFISHVTGADSSNSFFVTVTGSSGVSTETLIAAEVHRRKDYTASVNMAGVGTFVSMEIRKDGSDNAIVMEYQCQYAGAVYSWPDQRSGNVSCARLAQIVGHLLVTTRTACS